MENQLALGVEFPRVIDNTMRADFTECPQRFFRSFIQQLGPFEASTDLHAGGAFAAGMEAARKSYWMREQDPHTALMAGVEGAIAYWGDFQPPEKKMHKNIDRVISALDYYFEQWPLNTDLVKPYMDAGKPAVEFSFGIPLPIMHPTTGEPIIYAGRSDMIGEYKDALYIVDEKTTSQLGPTWPDKWPLRSQFMGYTWAARHQAQLPVAGCIIRGISFLKKGHGHSEAIVQHPEWLIERWYDQMLRDVERMLESYAGGHWHYAFGEACNTYGPCIFSRLCLSENPEQWITGSYKKRVWNPLEKVAAGHQEQRAVEHIELPAGVKLS